MKTTRQSGFTVIELIVVAVVLAIAGFVAFVQLNNLKIACSEAAPQIVHRALQILGVLGYKNDTPFSLGRHYRDVLSASLMISNERIASKSASMLLVYKDAS